MFFLSKEQISGILIFFSSGDHYFFCFLVYVLFLQILQLLQLFKIKTIENIIKLLNIKAITVFIELVK